MKLLLDVTYEREEPGLPTRLFAKFSRHFDDPFRDRRRYELQSEVHLADLSLLPEFPVAVPRPCFADFEVQSGTGLLITERIAFGEGPIEPLHPKCMDHLMDDPGDHYRALITSQARLAAAQKGGRLSPKLEQLFHFDAVSAAQDMPLAGDADGLRAKARGWKGFAARCPQLFHEGLSDPAFFARLEEDVALFHAHDADVRRFLHSDPDLIALCHWNSNIDNAWFWRDESGELQCGQLDWGMVRQMNVGYGLWGGFSASDHSFLERELDGLLGHYAEQLAEHGGPSVSLETLTLHFELSTALLGLSLMMDTPTLIASRVGEIDRETGLHDPILRANQVAHGFLHVSTNFLNLWKTRDFGESLRRMLATG